MHLRLIQPCLVPHESAVRLVLFLNGISSKRLVRVALWLCSKADPEGTVVPIASEYRTELEMSTQSFHNYLGMLRDRHLLSGDDGVYSLAPVLYECYGKKEINFEIKYTDAAG